MKNQEKKHEKNKGQLTNDRNLRIIASWKAFSTPFPISGISSRALFLHKDGGGVYSPALFFIKMEGVYILERLFFIKMEGVYLLQRCFFIKMEHRPSRNHSTHRSIP